MDEWYRYDFDGLIKNDKQYWTSFVTTILFENVIDNCISMWLSSLHLLWTYINYIVRCWKWNDGDVVFSLIDLVKYACFLPSQIYHILMHLHHACFWWFISGRWVVMVKHNNVVPNGHFKKHWQNYVKTWFNQPARKTRRRIGRKPTVFLFQMLINRSILYFSWCLSFYLFTVFLICVTCTLN